jgi:hypothetical protein
MHNVHTRTNESTPQKIPQKFARQHYISITTPITPGNYMLLECRTRWVETSTWNTAGYKNIDGRLLLESSCIYICKVISSLSRFPSARNLPSIVDRFELWYLLSSDSRIVWWINTIINQLLIFNHLQDGYN